MLNFEALVRVSRFKKMTGNVGVGFHSTLKRWIYILFLFWYLLPMRIIQDGAIIWRVGGEEFNRSQSRYSFLFIQSRAWAVSVILCITAEAQRFCVSEADCTKAVHVHSLIIGLRTAWDLYIFVTRGYFIARKASNHFALSPFLPLNAFLSLNPKWARYCSYWASVLTSSL